MGIILRSEDVPPDLMEFFEPANEGGMGSVLTIPTEPYRGAHFATYPTALVTPCVLSSTSAEGVCSACGAPWRREVAALSARTRPGRSSATDETKDHFIEKGSGGNTNLRYRPVVSTQTLGWRPSCRCNAAVEPATVLDPFAGSATTGAVAIQHGRRFVGIELSERYCRLAAKRLRGAVPALPFTAEAPAVPEPAQLTFEVE